MSNDKEKAISATAMSVRDRLLNLAGGRGNTTSPIAYNTLLRRYFQERLLWRLSLLPDRDNFILKGGLRLIGVGFAWARATKDIDFLGYGTPEPTRLVEVFQRVCGVVSSETILNDDGVRYDPDSVEAHPILEGAEYGGIRITLIGYLGTAREKLQIDVGFGDAITPGPVWLDLPPLLLGLGSPHLLAYNDETTVAEKFHAMVRLGAANSRMKDFHDLYRFAVTTSFDGRSLYAAVLRTFDRRETPFAEDEFVLSPAFMNDNSKQSQWNAFRRGLRGAAVELPEAFADVVTVIQAFLTPVHKACRHQELLSSSWNSVAGFWE
jgi:predicted nucleotidyltransferase component of viral defense system